MMEVVPPSKYKTDDEYFAETYEKLQLSPLNKIIGFKDIEPPKPFVVTSPYKYKQYVYKEEPPVDYKRAERNRKLS